MVAEIWDITGTEVERHLSYNEDYEVFYTQLKYTVNLQRKPLYYVINIVIPFILLIVVVLMVTSYTLSQKWETPCYIRQVNGVKLTDILF